LSPPSTSVFLHAVRPSWVVVLAHKRRALSRRVACTLADRNDRALTLPRRVMTPTSTPPPIAEADTNAAATDAPTSYELPSR
jgi:hypothetical protein